VSNSADSVRYDRPISGTHADAFEQFGRLASSSAEETITAGRYPFQSDAEARIADDISAKLAFENSSTLLDIGCGSGAISRRLAPRVRAVTGVDHPSFAPPTDEHEASNLTFIAGRWPDVVVPGRFNRVLMYSVLHYFEGPQKAIQAVEACVSALAPDGRLLIGDLPNQDAKARFLATHAGRNFTEQWRKRVRGVNEAASEALGTLGAGLVAFIDDEFILDLLHHLRTYGLEAYTLSQPSELPFSRTREDILVWRRPE
jgi:2-polyprenyl-3-methyl-5-hydroxy-6-metoxy-1,4-benzoquinol methylase